MRDLLTPFVALSILSPWLFAQGSPPVSGGWQYGSIMPETFGSQCAPPAPVHAVLEQATFTLRSDGTGSGSHTSFDVCPGGVCSQSSGNASLMFDVLPDGVVLLRDDPRIPGADLEPAFLRSDGSVLMFGRAHDRADEPYLGVLVALSSGQSTAALSGDYGFVRLVLRNDPSAQTMRGDYGTLTFDGVGSFQETSDHHQVTWNGGTAPPTIFSGSDTYAVAPDGTVTTGGGGLGALSPDREFLFWVRHACPEVEMVLAVRLPGAGEPTFVDGDWRLCSTEIDVGTGGLESDWGTISLATPGPSGGVLTPSLLRVATTSTTFGTTTSTASPANDSFTLGVGGAITLFSQATQRRPIPGWVSRDGSVLIGAPSMPPRTGFSPACGVTLGLTRCALPTPVGAGTPGTAGVVPQLFSIGGFPYPGNGDFGFVVATGLGGAPGLILISGGVLAVAIPIAGVDLWIDPLQLAVSANVVLSGPAGVPGVGAAGLPLVLPSTPTIAGATLAVQAIVLDAGALQGLSASRALDVRVQR